MRYLLRHPEAKDTAEGIATWWLREEGEKFSAADLLNPLKSLVARGWIRETKQLPGATIYGLRKEEELEIKRFLNL